MVKPAGGCSCRFDQQPTCRQQQGAVAHVNRLLGTLGPGHQETPQPSPAPPPPHTHTQPSAPCPHTQPAQLIRLNVCLRHHPPGQPSTHCHLSTTHPRVPNRKSQNTCSTGLSLCLLTHPQKQPTHPRPPSAVAHHPIHQPAQNTNPASPNCTGCTTPAVMHIPPRAAHAGGLHCCWHPL
jgi:hypothetical protein